MGLMTPVILSGGSGTRLWPFSRTTFPKQFLEIFGESLMSRTYKRVSHFSSPWTITVQSLKVLTEKVCGELSIPKEQIILEPFGRNTSAAIALICHHMQSKGLTNEVLAVFPADHLIKDEERFKESLLLAEKVAQEGFIVTLGIKPDHPATGYGYIEVSKEPIQSSKNNSAFKVKAFREKPDLKTAEEFLRQGGYFWNGGMFVFKVSVMIDHFKELLPELWAQITKVKIDFSNLKEVYDQVPSVSIDYGIMEKSSKVACIPCDMGWSDVGSWDEAAQVTDEKAIVIQENSQNNFVFGQTEKVYGFVGVDDLIVADTADSLVVMKKGQTQAVKNLLDQVKTQKLKCAGEHVFEHRPWGKFEILRDTEKFKSKVIVVDPGQQISYQSHAKRAEHWIIVSGEPEVVLNDEVLKPKVGEAVFIPLGAKHMIRNLTKSKVEFVEVQVGTYFGEDDIVRYSDVYGRK
jgi:mannose-1-phosphate guanylyltransferase/mannose-6-phosphate isomerase